MPDGGETEVVQAAAAAAVAASSAALDRLVPMLTQRIDETNRRFSGLETAVAALSAKLDERIDGLGAKVDIRLEAFSKLLLDITSRIQDHDVRLRMMERNLDEERLNRQANRRAAWGPLATISVGAVSAALAAGGVYLALYRVMHPH